jgi:protein-L-isoaspartate(D-aspartate) O-methyltransferase
MMERVRLLSILLAVSAMMTCVSAEEVTQRGSADNRTNDNRVAERERMVETQIRARGVADERVLAAMRRVPRHLFVPPEHQARAYDDSPLPIGFDQTISQPYIVGYMSEVLDTKPTDRVLEIGTGSGYQAAILSVLVGDVYSIEIVEPLAIRARDTMAALGYANVQVRHGNGYLGWPEAAPFDKIIVTAAPPEVPRALIDQLASGGMMVVPVGRGEQTMTIVRKTTGGVTMTETIPVRFVPMVGKER